MAALDKNLNVEHLAGTLTKIAVPCDGADKFYAGALAYYKYSSTASGKLTVAPAATDRFAGVVAKYVETLAADELVEIVIDGVIGLPAAIANIDALDMGDFLGFDINVGAATDNVADLIPLTGVTLAAGDICIGKAVGIQGGKMLVKLDPKTYTAAGWI